MLALLITKTKILLWSPIYITAKYISLNMTFKNKFALVFFFIYQLFHECMHHLNFILRISSQELELMTFSCGCHSFFWLAIYFCNAIISFVVLLFLDCFHSKQIWKHFMLKEYVSMLINTISIGFLPYTLFLPPV